MFENFKKKVGDTIVDGTKASVKEDLEQFVEDVLPTVITVAALALGIKAAFNLINRPKPAVSNVHFYIHMVP